MPGSMKFTRLLVTLGVIGLIGLIAPDCAGNRAFVRVTAPSIAGKEEVYYLDFRYFRIERAWRERILGRDEGFVLVVVYCRKHGAYITLLLREGQGWNYLPTLLADQDLEERLFKADEQRTKQLRRE